jgi:hypothetical protein
MFDFDAEVHQYIGLKVAAMATAEKLVDGKGAVSLRPPSSTPPSPAVASGTSTPTAYRSIATPSNPGGASVGSAPTGSASAARAYSLRTPPRTPERSRAFDADALDANAFGGTALPNSTALRGNSLNTTLGGGARAGRFAPRSCGFFREHFGRFDDRLVAGMSLLPCPESWLIAP